MRTTEINTSVGANTPRRLALPKTSLEPQNLESRGGTQVPTPPKPIAAAPWREKATSARASVHPAVADARRPTATLRASALQLRQRRF